MSDYRALESDSSLGKGHGRASFAGNLKSSFTSPLAGSPTRPQMPKGKHQSSPAPGWATQQAPNVSEGVPVTLLPRSSTGTSEPTEVSRFDVVYHFLSTVWCAPLSAGARIIDQAEGISFSALSRISIARLFMFLLVLAIFCFFLIWVIFTYYWAGAYNPRNIPEITDQITVSVSSCYLEIEGRNCDKNAPPFKYFGSVYRFSQSVFEIENNPWDTRCQFSLCVSAFIQKRLQTVAASRLKTNLNLTTSLSTVVIRNFPPWLTVNVVSKSGKEDASRIIVDNSPSATVSLVAGIVIVTNVASCAAAYSCAMCTAFPQCGWCGATSTCYITDMHLDGPYGATCSQGWVNDRESCPAQPAPPAVQCSAYASCSSCNANSNCQWCADEDLCKEFTATCAAPVYTGQCPFRCADAHSCQSCTLQGRSNLPLRCVWCGATSTCSASCTGSEIANISECPNSKSAAQVLIENSFGPVYIVAPEQTLPRSSQRITSFPLTFVKNEMFANHRGWPSCVDKSVGYLVTTDSQFKPSASIVVNRATSIYGQRMYSAEGDMSASLEGMGNTTLSPSVVNTLNETDTWFAGSRIPMYVQAIQVVSPTIGFVLLNTNRPLVIEFGPTMLHIVTYGIMKSFYRQLYSPLSHYGCKPIRNFQRMGSLANTYQLLSEDAMNVMFPYAHDLNQAAEAMGQVQETVSKVVPTSSSYYVPVKGSYTSNYYNLERVFNGYSESLVEPSVAGYTVFAISCLVAALLVLTIGAVLWKFRRPIVRKIFLYRSRQNNRLRAKVDPGSCRYSAYFGYTFLCHWIAVCIIRILENKLLSAQFSTEACTQSFLLSYVRKSPKKIIPLSLFTQHLRAFAELSFWKGKTIAKEEIVAASIPHIQWPDGSGVALEEVEVSVVLGIARMVRKNSPEQVFNDCFSLTNNPYDAIPVIEIEQTSSLDEVAILVEADSLKLQVIRQRMLVVRDAELRPPSEQEIDVIVKTNEYICTGFPVHTELRATAVLALGRTSRSKLALATGICLQAILGGVLVNFPVFVVMWGFTVTRLVASKYTAANTDFGDNFLYNMFVPGATRDPVWSSVPIIYVVVSFFLFAEPVLLMIFQTLAAFVPPHLSTPILRVSLAFRLLFLVVATIFIGAIFFWVFIIFQWWVLGAIIAPNQMLPFATASATFVVTAFSLSSSLKNSQNEVATTLQQKAIEKLQEKIKACPVELPFLSDGENSKAIVVVKAVSQINGELISELRQLKPDAVAKFSAFSGVPEDMVELVIRIAKRDRSEGFVQSISALLFRLKVPSEVIPVAKIAALALADGAVSRDLYDEFINVSFPSESRHVALEFDSFFVALMRFLCTRIRQSATTYRGLTSTSSNADDAPGELFTELLGAVIRTGLGNKPSTDELRSALSALLGEVATGIATFRKPISVVPTAASIVSPERLLVKLSGVMKALCTADFLSAHALSVGKLLAGIAERVSATSTAGVPLSFAQVIPREEAQHVAMHMLGSLEEEFSEQLASLLSMVGLNVASFFVPASKQAREKPSASTSANSSSRGVTTLVQIRAKRWGELLRQISSLCTAVESGVSNRLRCEVEADLEKLTRGEWKESSVAKLIDRLGFALATGEMPTTTISSTCSSTYEKFPISNKLEEIADEQKKTWTKLTQLMISIHRCATATSSGASAKPTKKSRHAVRLAQLLVTTPALASFFSPAIVKEVMNAAEAYLSKEVVSFERKTAVQSEPQRRAPIASAASGPPKMDLTTVMELLLSSTVDDDASALELRDMPIVESERHCVGAEPSHTLFATEADFKLAVTVLNGLPPNYGAGVDKCTAAFGRLIAVFTREEIVKRHRQQNNDDDDSSGYEILSSPSGSSSVNVLLSELCTHLLLDDSVLQLSDRSDVILKKVIGHLGAIAAGCLSNVGSTSMLRNAGGGELLVEIVINFHVLLDPTLAFVADQTKHNDKKVSKPGVDSIESVRIRNMIFSFAKNTAALANSIKVSTESRGKEESVDHGDDVQHAVIQQLLLQNEMESNTATAESILDEIWRESESDVWRYLRDYTRRADSNIQSKSETISQSDTAERRIFNILYMSLDESSQTKTAPISVEEFFSKCKNILRRLVDLSNLEISGAESLALLYLLRHRCPRTEVQSLASSLLGEKEAQRIASFWQCAVVHNVSATAGDCLKPMLRQMRTLGVPKDLTRAMLLLCLAWGGFCRAPDVYLLRKLLELDLLPALGSGGISAWNLYVQSVSQRFTRNQASTGEKKSWTPTDATFAELVHPSSRRWLEEVLQNPHLAVFPSSSSESETLFDQKMLRFVHAVCMNQTDTAHISAHQAVNAFVKEAPAALSTRLAPCAPLIGTLMTAAVSFACAPGNAGIEKKASMLATIFRGVAFYLHSNPTVSKMNIAPLVLYCGDLLDSTVNYGCPTLPRWLSKPINQSCAAVMTDSPTAAAATQLGTDLCGCYDVVGSLFSLIRLLPQQEVHTQTITKHTSSVLLEAWLSLGAMLRRAASAGANSPNKSDIFARCLAVGVALSVSAVAPDNAAEIISRTNVEELVKGLLQTINNDELRPLQKVATLLPLLLKSEDTSVVKTVHLLIEVASGDFSVMPEILKRIGAPLPNEVEEVAVACLGVLSKLGKTESLADSARAVAITSAKNKLADELFQQLDINNEGAISMDRIVSAVKLIGLEIPNDEAKALFQNIDKSGDGVIDQDEFRSAFDLVVKKIVDGVLAEMELKPSQIVVTLAIILAFLGVFLIFVLLGAYVFSDGSVFTAVISGVLPMLSGATNKLSQGTAILSDEAERFLNNIL